ncbi:hypothetical protein [Methylocaldum sp. 14B]|uniref:hypothetical protein n=1 Tax=Methylocaldum sp. 14B TaxID=1912213 RepID=UPI001439F0E9|nr:hypothetical protein [Methylocaldum sp. 14B]
MLKSSENLFRRSHYDQSAELDDHAPFHPWHVAFYGKFCLALRLFEGVCNRFGLAFR